jgi:hypothetical protein
MSRSEATWFGLSNELLEIRFTLSSILRHSVQPCKTASRSGKRSGNRNGNRSGKKQEDRKAKSDTDAHRWTRIENGGRVGELENKDSEVKVKVGNACAHAHLTLASLCNSF